MPLTSYAQNFEDVMLCRALRSVEAGNYIDIGAQDPTFDSVSRHFFESGWKGVHVEPHPEYAAQLRAARSGDLVLEVAVGALAGLTSFHAFAGTGLSTFVDDVASRHVDAGFSKQSITVPCITLDDLFDKCGFDEIHWLKVDVEGAEAAVFSGWKESLKRPWIIVVEAIAPGERAKTSDTYEVMLESKGYHFVYFDGLNRFYVSDLHSELDQHFLYGPSLWDEIQAPKESRIVRELIDEFQNEIRTLNSSISNDQALAQKAIAEAENAASDSRRDATLTASELEAVSDERNRLQTELRELAALSEKFQSDLIAQQAQSQELSNLLAGCRSELGETSLHNASLRQELIGSQTEVLRLTDRLHEQHEISRSEGARAEEAGQALRVALSELGAARVSRDGLEAALAAKLERLIEAQLSLQTVRRDLSDFRKNVAEADARSASLQFDLSKLQEAFEIQSSSLDLSIGKCLTLEADLKALEVAFGAKVEETAAREAEIATLKRDLQHLESRLQGCERDSIGLNNQLNSRVAEIQWLVGSLEALASATTGSLSSSLRGILAEAPKSRSVLAQSDDFVARSMDELLLVGERAFVEACYQTLLGRRGDRSGINHYLEKLAGGTSRCAVIADIARSKEAKAFASPTPGLSHFVKRQRTFGARLARLMPEWIPGARPYQSAVSLETELQASTGQPLTVKEVLALPGDVFLRAAYYLVLRREPDPSGMAHFSARLAGGDERLDLLSALRWSPEGNAIKHHMHDVQKATTWYVTRKWPLIGKSRRKRAIGKWMPSGHQRLRSIEATLSKLEMAVQARKGSQVQLIGQPIRLVPGNTEAEARAVEVIERGLNHLSGAHSSSQTMDVKIGGGPDTIGKANIWYADVQSTAAISDLHPLPASLEAIACCDQTTEMALINKGLAVAIRAIGEPISSAAALRLAQFASDLERSKPRRDALSRDRALKVAILTTWNSRCGIATHSEELVEAFPQGNFEIIAPHQGDLLEPDQANVFRLWQTSKLENHLDFVLEHLRSHQTELLIVQFNFGFYNHSQLSVFLNEAASLGTTVFIIFHSTHEPVDADGWRVSEMVDGLARCCRIIVHSPNDVAKLELLGMTENVLLMPHGVRSGHALSERRLLGAEATLSSFGFCLPNKGLVELVHAVALLRERNIAIRLKMFNALHPDPSSAETMLSIREAIAKLSLEGVVEVIPEFLDSNTLDCEIAKTDLFVNPYQRTGESASGAVRIGLRNKVPTVVTPLSIFDDLGETVFRMPGIGPEHIADGIASALATLRDPEAAKLQMDTLESWLLTHDFRTQARRLDGICRTLRVNALAKERRN